MKPTGGGPQITPVPPPNSLFPGITNALSNNPLLGKDLFTNLHDITSGLDVNKIFQSITDANQRMQSEGMGQIQESMGAMGLRGGSDVMRAMVDYKLQATKDLSAQLGSLSFDAESLKLGGAQMLMQLATSFAPSVVVGQAPAGPSGLSQITSAGEATAMIFLLI